MAIELTHLIIVKNLTLNKVNAKKGFIVNLTLTELI